MTPLSPSHKTDQNKRYMSAALREFYQQEWLREMRTHCKNGRFELLPSEAAAIVAARWSVEPATVLLAFAPAA